ncbi:hypothetical protein GCM10027160_29460 [Streptomyces calidiresistens]|uniref:Helix-turn-helix domain-containing protein n=1 Tax=Streptomyces calidiresistens TaxID=1485586 RepID=A0A7W3XVT5_9ACTN|nr:helix-turn-helix transcriptional regulator [Streptomyces calidiresistens]MBB0229133.1 helix-turn-helix domain-containing protein [Streptomyces calidiresistens]
MTQSRDASPARVGRALARRREDLDLTQEALARAIGITPATVSVTERGKTRIRRSKRSAWERALGLRAGTITRAYERDEELEAETERAATPQPYADMSDRLERAIWMMQQVSESDRKVLIDILREGRGQVGGERHTSA